MLASELPDCSVLAAAAAQEQLINDAEWDTGQVIAPPESDADQPAWLSALRSWREECADVLGWNAGDLVIANPALEWTQTAFVHVSASMQLGSNDADALLRQSHPARQVHQDVPSSKTARLPNADVLNYLLPNLCLCVRTTFQLAFTVSAHNISACFNTCQVVAEHNPIRALPHPPARLFLA
eukprot:416321-Pleurochrysis_carterae.AAC.1